MNDAMMAKLLALPRNRWMLLERGMSQSLRSTLATNYTNHTLVETPVGPLRVLRMGRALMAGRGGSYDVYALCEKRKAPMNPAWDSFGRLVVDGRTRLVEVEATPEATPMSAWASETERQETLAELRELRFQRDELKARLVGMMREETEADGFREEVDMALGLVKAAQDQARACGTRQGRVVAAMLGLAVDALEGQP
tara:strand:+ start:987 stop:1577 length:591 start_codon:yes stop_codon:yes gene_type:complete